MVMWLKEGMFFVLVLIFLVSCTTQLPVDSTDAAEEPITLSELQTEACTVADQAGTCDTRLAEIGIVTKENCCQVMGKCC